MYDWNNYIVLDLETTNLDKGDANNPNNSLVCSAYKPKEGIIKTIWGNEFEQSELLDNIASVDFIVGHNIKFDLKWLARAGLDLTKVKVYDTQIAEYVLAGNKQMPFDLGSVSVRYGGQNKSPFIDKAIKAGVCPSVLPRSFLDARVQLDVETTELVLRQQIPLLEKQGLVGCVYTACRLTPCLADIEARGLKLDEHRVRAEYEACLAEFTEVDRRIAELSGGINPRSSKQVAEFLYDTLGFEELKDRRGNPIRTASGKRGTSTSCIAGLRPRNQKQRDFLTLKSQHSNLEANLSKALEKFKECVDAKDLLFAGFNQTRTATHRLSSSGTKYKTQFQNLHRKFKSLFKAREDGWLIGEVDGAQLEFRVAAFLGQDTRAAQDIREGIDVHSFTRDTITAAGQPIDRQNAKAHTFKPLYGGQSGTKAEQAYYEAFRLKYKGITETQNRWIGTVVDKKCLRTITGLTFYWPDTRVQPSGYVTNRESICNYPVQYFATGEIIPIAVVALWKAMKKHNMKSFLVNTVHDSVVAEIHPDEVELFKKLAVKAFTTRVFKYLNKYYDIQFNVPLGCGIKIGTHWGTGEEEKYNVEPSWNG